MKKIKNTIENVAKVLSARAINSNYECVLFDDDKQDIQFAIYGESVPLITDVEGIVSSFYENARSIMDVDYGFDVITIYLSEGEPKKEVDTMSLAMYLPYGALETMFK